ncbi:MalY/PatB family protein [Oceanomicrobium pacificus]|uniref:cysteine-S-conjugate beta-lyase n=1 Tax=Oceanomicrobium pacificus TaxID=2692916 RepID=A0A6B0TQA2_9RHOB|nr:MalY/PatB family protein [Oceanomicrobium pacificus]MXU63975.1 putative C-S lyase [Oceanomicrobium pacificus]
MPFDFDEVIPRIGTHCNKWDDLHSVYGLDPSDAIPMWVADMDFKAPPAVNEALQAHAAHGVHGYPGDKGAYHAAIAGWMERRHGWTVDPDWILSTHGLVNGTSMCLQAFTEPGDGVILFTPVYHAFARVITASGRRVVECPLVQVDGRYEMDLDAAAAALDGSEKMVIFCSPHNPGGRVWRREEIAALGAFCETHDLMLVSDEVHQDITFGRGTHLPAPLALPDLSHRLVVMNAITKTFNMAGALTGNVIIADATLRRRFAHTLTANGIGLNGFGARLVTAAYSDGDVWVDALCTYLEGNRQILHDGLNAIPGVRSMPLDATYLGWADFENTGLTPDEVKKRVVDDAKVAPSYGATFGAGGEQFLRFNFATRRALVVEAVERLHKAFDDLQ